METVLPSEFKHMMVVILEGAPYIIEEFHQSGTAQTKHKLHTRLRHLKTGHMMDRVFAENERVPVAHLKRGNHSRGHCLQEIRRQANLVTCVC
jgi:translation elongation factor P/translation initiation factor 5A